MDEPQPSTYQWIPIRDDKSRPADLWVLANRRLLEPDDHYHFAVQDELARVRRLGDADAGWEWEAAGSTGTSRDDSTARRAAEDALREAGVSF